MKHEWKLIDVSIDNFSFSFFLSDQSSWCFIIKKAELAKICVTKTYTTHAIIITRRTITTTIIITTITHD